MEGERGLGFEDMLAGSISSLAKKNGFEQVFVREVYKEMHEVLREVYSFRTVQGGDRVVLQRHLRSWTHPVFSPSQIWLWTSFVNSWLCSG